jgi:hypothetical protein
LTLERWRLATDRWTNPILLKELRATFRGWWFLAVHTAFLGVLSLAVVIAILSFGDEAELQPSTVGRWLHQIYVAGLALAAVTILPSFASTALVTEREQNTFEMLQTTTLAPAAVVRGKFLASMVYAALFLVSSLPVWAVAFLFGGVGIGNLAASFGMILALSALANIVSVFISAVARSSRTALMGTAASGLLIGAALPAFAANLPPEYQRQAVTLLGFDLRLLPRFVPAPASPWMSLLYLGVVPAFLGAAFFAFSAVSASNRLKTRAENRSTNLKIFYVALLYGGTALWWALVQAEPFTTLWARWATVATLFGAVGVLATLSAFFSAEEPVAALPAPLRPGSVNGFAFTLAANALLLAPAVLLADRFMDSALGPRNSFALPLLGIAVTILGFLYLAGATGLFLSSVFRSERLRMALQSALASLLLFAPLVGFAVLHRFRDLPSVSALDPGLLSPVVTFGTLTTGWFETAVPAGSGVAAVSVFPFQARLGKAFFPAFSVSVAFDLLLGTILLWIAWRRLRAGARDRERERDGGAEESAEGNPTAAEGGS